MLKRRQPAEATLFHTLESLPLFQPKIFQSAGRNNIQGVRKIAANISGGDSGPQKKEKKLYKHRSENKSFPSYSHFYVKKIVFYSPRGIPF